MLELKEVTQKYICRSKEEVPVLSGLSLSFPSTGFVMINGISGSGKTTLVNMLSGRLPPTEGEILFEGNSIYNNPRFSIENFKRFDIAYVDQDSSLLQDRNVYHNILFSLLLQNKRTDKKLKKEIDNILKKLNILDIKKSKISEISGGQRQRVCLAIAILKKSKIIFADESTASLDETNAKQVLSLLKELSQNCLILYITHQIELVKSYADINMVFTSTGDVLFLHGKLQQNQCVKTEKHKMCFRNVLQMYCFEVWNMLKKIWASTISFSIFLFICLLFMSFSTTNPQHLERELSKQNQQIVFADGDIEYEHAYARRVEAEIGEYPFTLYASKIDDFLLQSLGNKLTGRLATTQGEVNVCSFFYDLLCEVNKKESVSTYKGYSIVGIIETSLSYDDLKKNGYTENKDLKEEYRIRMDNEIQMHVFFPTIDEENIFDYIWAFDTFSASTVSNLILSNPQGHQVKNIMVEKFMDFSFSKETYHSIFLLGGSISFLIGLVFLFSIISFITRQLHTVSKRKFTFGLGKKHVFFQYYFSFIFIIGLGMLLCILLSKIVFIFLPSIYFYFSFVNSLKIMLLEFGFIILSLLFYLLYYFNKNIDY